MSSIEHCDFPWIMIFLSKLILIVIKGTALSPALICLFVCIHTTRATIDHMIFKSAFLDYYIEIDDNIAQKERVASRLFVQPA